MTVLPSPTPTTGTAIATSAGPFSSMLEFDVHRELYRSACSVVFLARVKTGNDVVPKGTQVVLKKRPYTAADLQNEQQPGSAPKRMNKAGRKNILDNFSLLHEYGLLMECRGHKNVIDCYGYFLEDRHLVLVIEYAAKGDLNKELRIRQKTAKSFRESEVWDLFLQILHGLRFVHGKGIVHRDVKTLNVFLTKDGYCKLGDFGVSRRMEPECDLLSSFYGTPLYLSPEIISGSGYTRKTDIWSLGVVLYEVATNGRMPFSGNSLRDVTNAVLAGRYKALLNKNFGKIVHLCLQKDPNRRPNADELYALVKEMITASRKQERGMLNSPEDGDIFTGSAASSSSSRRVVQSASSAAPSSSSSSTGVARNRSNDRRSGPASSAVSSNSSAVVSSSSSHAHWNNIRPAEERRLRAASMQRPPYFPSHEAQERAAAEGSGSRGRRRRGDDKNKSARQRAASWVPTAVVENEQRASSSDSERRFPPGVMTRPLRSGGKVVGRTDFHDPKKEHYAAALQNSQRRAETEGASDEARVEDHDKDPASKRRSVTPKIGALNSPNMEATKPSAFGTSRREASQQEKNANLLLADDDDDSDTCLLRDRLYEQVLARHHSRSRRNDQGPAPDESVSAFRGAHGQARLDNQNKDHDRLHSGEPRPTRSHSRGRERSRSSKNRASPPRGTSQSSPSSPRTQRERSRSRSADKGGDRQHAIERRSRSRCASGERPKQVAAYYQDAHTTPPEQRQSLLRDAPLTKDRRMLAEGTEDDFAFSTSLYGSAACYPRRPRPAGKPSDFGRETGDGSIAVVRVGKRKKQAAPAAPLDDTDTESSLTPRFSPPGRRSSHSRSSRPGQEVFHRPRDRDHEKERLRNSAPPGRANKNRGNNNDEREPETRTRHSGERTTKNLPFVGELRLPQPKQVEGSPLASARTNLVGSPEYFAKQGPVLRLHDEPTAARVLSGQQDMVGDPDNACLSPKLSPSRAEPVSPSVLFDHEAAHHRLWKADDHMSPKDPRYPLAEVPWSRSRPAASSRAGHRGSKHRDFQQHSVINYLRHKSPSSLSTRASTGMKTSKPTTLSRPQSARTQRWQGRREDQLSASWRATGVVAPPRGDENWAPQERGLHNYATAPTQPPARIITVKKQPPIVPCSSTTEEVEPAAPLTAEEQRREHIFGPATTRRHWYIDKHQNPATKVETLVAPPAARSTAPAGGLQRLGTNAGPRTVKIRRFDVINQIWV
ncbi:unnamed protein product [Amoebophrya sp. A120]|nr:unnamed protein product [Amoebophrya sp. A120]|eukprot:GSA120T00002320001.1